MDIDANTLENALDVLGQRLADQGPQSKHFADLKFLNPTEPELKEAQQWCLTQDVSREFSETLNEVLECVLVSK